ncbi:glycosyltransferase family 39 protein [Leifsonia sp. 21MFCrub1.1]|uniref:glycosyltransferase family 39 protein n=1 Tax=Leifsonia sp. 21MFCrub1.1 TaxID=1798223 RepID=UPI0008928BBE|nr:glycosyltransferase family 39 protein [Leifsonia sp. 21MFCrub1.1]SEB00407.1 Dolichyl-phosphate-mannose-protein mannosyltransferase [Leifsonia sp. 21MFCrub1.1]
MTSTLVEPSTRSNRFALWLRRFWVPVLLVVVALGYSGASTLMHSDSLSPIDEWVYSDYLDKVPTELLVHQGETVGHEALDRMACHGVYPYGPMGARCGSSYSDVTKFPFAGKTSADAYTPAYFVVTWVVGGALHLVPGVDQLAGWRLTGALWLAATMVLLFLLFRKFSVPAPVTVALGLAFMVSPFAWWTYTYVSTDAPSVFFAALLLLLATRFARGEGSGWWVVGMSAAAVVFKVTNILAVCLIALYLVFVWLWELRRTRWTEGWRTHRPGLVERRSLGVPLIAVLAVAAGVAAQLVWLQIHKAIAVGPSANQGLGGPLALKELANQLINFLPGTLTSNVWITGGSGYALPIYNWAVEPLSWLCIGGVLGAFWSALARRRRTGPVVLATAIASVAFAPMLAVVLTITTGSYFQLPPRYGAPLLAAFLLMPALLIRNRWATWVITGYAVLLGIAMLILTAMLSRV